MLRVNHAEQPPSMHENVAVVFNANTQNCKTIRCSNGRPTCSQIRFNAVWHASSRRTFNCIGN